LIFKVSTSGINVATSGAFDPSTRRNRSVMASLCEGMTGMLLRPTYAGASPFGASCALDRRGLKHLQSAAGGWSGCRLTSAMARDKVAPIGSPRSSDLHIPNRWRS
jgi:hypothetical protein